MGARGRLGPQGPHSVDSQVLGIFFEFPVHEVHITESSVTATFESLLFT